MRIAYLGPAGTFTEDALGLAAPAGDFEPLRTPFEALSRVAASDSGWEVHRLALGDSGGRRLMNVSSNMTSSSFLKVAESHTNALATSRFVAREEVEAPRRWRLPRSARLSPARSARSD